MHTVQEWDCPALPQRLQEPIRKAAWQSHKVFFSYELQCPSINGWGKCARFLLTLGVQGVRGKEMKTKLGVGKEGDWGVRGPGLNSRGTTHWPGDLGHFPEPVVHREVRGLPTGALQ